MPIKFKPNLFLKAPITRQVMPPHQILFDNGILVAPDILANPGGIIAAFVEMTSDSNNKAKEAMEMTEKKSFCQYS